MSKTGLRRPRFQRSPSPNGLTLIERDIAILALVCRYRFLQSHHITRLIPGSHQHLVRRLARLYHAGFLDRPSSQRLLAPHGGQPLVYQLTDVARRQLCARHFPTFATSPRLRGAASALSLSHALGVSNTLVAFEAGAGSAGGLLRMHHDWTDAQPEPGNLSVLRWSLSVALDGLTSRVGVIPDAAFSIQSSSDSPPSYFLLEYDRGTMPLERTDPSQTSFRRKVLAYKETRRLGVLWKRFQVPAFRVLVVAESEQRMGNLMQTTARCFERGDSKMFLFGTARRVLEAASPFETPWQTCAGKAINLVP